MKLEAEILEEVKKNVQGMQFKTLAKKLKMFREKDKATLRICLNNLESARIITFNHNKDIITVATINDFIYKGIIKIDKKTGCGYLKSAGKRFIIRNDYLNGALNGDTVLIKSSNIDCEGRIIAFVDKIVERKNETINCIYRSDKLIPLSSEKQELKVNKNELKKIKENTIVKVKLNKSTNILAEYIENTIDYNDKYYLEKSIALKHGFPLEFSKETIAEVDNITDEISDEEISKRLDLRDLPIITIDCDDTKDMDDAVYAKQLENGNYELIVSIAHVSHYVNENNTPHLYNEACERGCSVYIDDYVDPMLPPKLSNDICSLNPEVDRLTISTIMEIDKNGKIVSGRIAKSIIRSKAKMKYSVVNNYIEDNESVPGYQNELGNQIKTLKVVSDIIEKNLVKLGKKNFTSNETEVKSDEFNQPIEFFKRSIGDAEKIIENCMIISNMYMAEYFMEEPFIYRIHDLPDEERLALVIDELNNKNYANLFKREFGVDNLNLLLDKISNIEDKEERAIISNLLLRCMSRAKYSTNNIGHYGLGLANYCHSTSPIRRLPDLLIQRLIDLKLSNNKPFSKNEREKIIRKLNFLCYKANSREIEEDAAEKESLKIKMINYMKNHTEELFTATITDIGSEKIYLLLNNNVTGFATIDDILFGSFTFNCKKNILCDNLKGTKLSTGDKLIVYYNGEEKENLLEFMVKDKFKQKSRTLTLNRIK